MTDSAELDRQLGEDAIPDRREHFSLQGMASSVGQRVPAFGKRDPALM